MKSLSIYLFRNDLRLLDNSTLVRACKSDYLLPLYVLDPQFVFDAETWYFKFKRQSQLKNMFLYESLHDLRQSLLSMNSNLMIYKGKTKSICSTLLKEYSKVYNVEFYIQKEQTYEEIQIEKQIESLCREMNIPFNSIHGNTMIEPLKNSVPKVFTSFRKIVESNLNIPKVQEIPTIPNPPKEAFGSEFQYDLVVPNTQLHKDSVIGHGGESEGLDRVKDYFFTFDLLKEYKDTRDGLIGSNYSSKFSPYLAHGCISPRYIYKEIQRYESTRIKNKSTYWLFFELLWRDFFKFIALDLGTELFTLNSDKWKTDKLKFEQWATGTTGIPFIDANMKELVETGYMSNRGRQNVASFLIKDLKLDWRLGAEYFESLLVDHDCASNYGNWLYASGYLDPRDRKFNTIKQSKDYDLNGDYIRLWLNLTNTDHTIHYPWVNQHSKYIKPMLIAPEWTKYTKENHHRKSKFTIKASK